MKSIFLEARYTKEVSLPASAIKKLPKHITLFMAVQFLGSLNNIKKQLENAGITVDLKETRHTRYLGQLYGCNNQLFKGTFKAFLYVGDGEFHPKAIALANNKPIFIYNPITKRFGEWKQSFFEEEKKKTLIAKKVFYTKTHIGVLVTTKTGQNKIKLGELLKKKFPEKKFYFLVFESLEFNRLEDFPFIECYVNTACERIAFEDRNKFPHPVINAEDILTSK